MRSPPGSVRPPRPNRTAKRRRQNGTDLPGALVGEIVPGLMQTRRVRVIVLVVQLLLKVTLLLGRLPRVLGRRRWGDVTFVIYARSPPNVCRCVQAGSPKSLASKRSRVRRRTRNGDQST